MVTGAQIPSTHSLLLPLHLQRECHCPPVCTILYILLSVLPTHSVLRMVSSTSVPHLVQMLYNSSKINSKLPTPMNASACYLTIPTLVLSRYSTHVTVVWINSNPFTLALCFRLRVVHCTLYIVPCTLYICTSYIHNTLYSLRFCTCVHAL